MIVLDENILKSQRLLLNSWRIRYRQIGHDLWRKGLKDDQILSLLIRTRHSTFFTRDLGFYDRNLSNKKYCLISLAVKKDEAAVFIRQLLRHPSFNTHAKRLGKVILVSHRRIVAFHTPTGQPHITTW